jgi:hypothetical protein
MPRSAKDAHVLPSLPWVRFSCSCLLLLTAGWQCARPPPGPEHPRVPEFRERRVEAVTSARPSATIATTTPAPPVASTGGTLWQAPPAAPTDNHASSKSDVARGPACTKLWAPAPRRRPCAREGERGLEDPEGRCDLELEFVQPLGKVYSRSFDQVSLLSREDRGFLVLNWIKLEPLSVPNDGAREQGASIVELSTTGSPVRQCFATSKGTSGAATGIRDATLDSRGRLALTGWIWGSGLSFGGESISSQKGYRSSYLAVLTDSNEHIFSTALGGASWNDASSVAVDARGNVAVAGTFNSTLRIGAREHTGFTPLGLYVAKFDASGRLLWVHTSPFGGRHIAAAVTFAEDGNLLVAGSYDQHLDFGTPLPEATRLELRGCPADKRRALERYRMFWVELDASGRQVRADSFGEPYAAASDVTTSPEGDVIVHGTFRKRLSLGGTPLRAPASQRDCGCDFDCEYPSVPFVARFDPQHRLVFQDTLPGARIVRASPGPSRSTIAEQGIAVSYAKRWGHQIPDDYRWRLEIRSPAGATQWSRTFEKLDLKSTAALGAGRLAALVHDPESSVLYLLIYAHSAPHAPPRE